MRRTRVLLIGNGPSRSADNNSWLDLLNEMAAEIGARRIRPGEYDKKPPPLLYEALLLEAMRQRKFSEFALKQKVAERLSALKPAEVHGELVRLDFDEILTTNYDHVLEDALVFSRASRRRRSAVSERRYSLFRSIALPDHRLLWYIHGDYQTPSSILLGYEQYGGYLQQLRALVTASVEYHQAKLGPVVRDDRRTSEKRSWVTRFFDSDVSIVGLGLDFAEVHLWWLLAFRARFYARSGNRPNTVEYLCRGDEAAKPNVALSGELGVRVRPIGDAHTPWPDYYARAIRVLREVPG